MDNIKNILAVVVVMGVLVGGGIWISSSVEEQTNTPQPSLGSLAGPDIPYSYLRWGAGNGVTVLPVSMTLNTATTTPCDLTSPNATTTLDSFSMNISTATSSAGTFVVATSTLPNATSTTPFYSPVAVAANTTRGLSFHGGNDNAIIAPNTHIVAGVSGVSYGYTYGGTCSATFVQL